MSNLKFRIGDFIRDMGDKDFIKFCDESIASLRTYVPDTYFTNNTDNIDRVLYDELVEARFCTECELEFIKKQSKYSNSRKSRGGTYDISLVYDIVGLDLTILIEEGSITSVEYMTRNGNTYDFTNEFLSMFNGEFDDKIDCAILARLTIEKNKLMGSEYLTVREAVCDTILRHLRGNVYSRFKTSDIDIFGLCILNETKLDIDEQLEEIATKLGYKTPEAFILENLEVEDDMCETLYQCSEEHEEIYLSSHYEYVIEGIVYIESGINGCRYFNYNPTYIEATNAEVTDIEYLNKNGVIVPNCKLSTSMGTSEGLFNELQFNSVADLVKFEYVVSSQHRIACSSLYGLVDYELENNDFWHTFTVLSRRV